MLVYVHGGSNRVGMGAMLRGDVLAAFGDIIVVNFNYRLGSLGNYSPLSDFLSVIPFFSCPNHFDNCYNQFCDKPLITVTLSVTSH